MVLVKDKSVVNLLNKSFHKKQGESGFGQSIEAYMQIMNPVSFKRKIQIEIWERPVIKDSDQTLSSGI